MPCSYWIMRSVGANCMWYYSAVVSSRLQLALSMPAEPIALKTSVDILKQ